MRRHWSGSNRQDARRSLSAFKSMFQKMTGWNQSLPLKLFSAGLLIWSQKHDRSLSTLARKARRHIWYQWKNHFGQQLINNKVRLTGDSFRNSMMQFNRLFNDWAVSPKGTVCSCGKNKQTEYHQSSQTIKLLSEPFFFLFPPGIMTPKQGEFNNV